MTLCHNHEGVLSLVAVLLVIPLGVVVVVAGVVAVFAHQRNARRRRGDEVEGWARARGWTVVEADHTAAGLACPPVERGGRARWVTRGCDGGGHPVVAFEWAHWESSGTDTVGGDGVAARTEVLTTVVASTVPGVHPMIQVSPGHPRRGLFGLGRPDPRTVVTGAAFDRHATMLADDPAHAARLLPPHALDRWVADPRTGALGFRLHGSWLVCWQPGGIGVERLERGLSVLGDLRTTIERTQAPA